MEETKSMNVEIENEEGQIQIADDVVAVIAEIAALEVDGIESIGGKNDLVQTMRGKKAAKGVKITVSEDEVFVELMCKLKYGTKLKEVGLNIQKKVKNSIETMTGLVVKTVDVHVVGIEFPKTKTAEEY
ncbi:MAG: Asp23/Gls24 family envelope stress response protein [Cellulosilyticaceae bacterium]